MQERDTQFDQNLNAIGRRLPRPADATDKQIQQWVQLTQTAPRRGRFLRFASLWARPAVHRWALTAAAAVMLAMGLFLAYQAKPQAVSADEVFRQIGATLDAQPILRLTVKNVVIDGSRLNFEFMGADAGQAMYAKLQANSVTGNPEKNVDISMARDGEQGWVHVRSMQWDEINPLGHMIPQDGALLVDVPVSPSTDEAVREFFPMGVRIQEMQALIESLRLAVPNLSVRNTPDGLVLLEGRITKPEDLNLQMLCQATDATQMVTDLTPSMMSSMTPKDLRGIVRNVKKNLAKSMSKEDYDTVSQRLDLLSMVAIQQLQNLPAQPDEQAQREFNEKLRSLLTDANIAIFYDPTSKRLLGVNINDVGPEKGVLSLRFDESQVDHAQLQREQFAEEANLRTMKRDEAIYMMLLPLLQPRDNTTVP